MISTRAAKKKPSGIVTLGKGGKTSPRGGAYLLLIHLKRTRRIRVGKLGVLYSPPGNYIYVGSAMAGLEKRVARHLRASKKTRWHIDYFLKDATAVGAVLYPSKKRKECSLARRVRGFLGAVAVPAFGCSDCSCEGHLFFIGDTHFGALLRALDKKGQ